MSASTTSRTRHDVPPQLLGAPTGMTFVDPATILRRQWFFDGKFLRAEGFRADQAYVRALVSLANTAVGSGVVHGYDVRLTGGDRLQVEAGLALAPSGRVVFLPGVVEVVIADLLARSAGMMDPADVAGPDHTDGGFAPCPPDSPPPTGEPVEARPLHVLTVAAADALCGQEERFGALCQDACDTDSDRSSAVDGVTLRLHEVRLTLPSSRAVTLTGRHHRGRVASAWFARERQGVPSMISGAGLRTPVWCAGAPGVGGEEVPIALLDRLGQVTTWVDQWIARRELVETSPQRYWQWRMAMRPLDVFLAQVLQFQCQLLERAGEGDDGSPEDCHDVLAAADAVIADLRRPPVGVAAQPPEEVEAELATGSPGPAAALPVGMLGRLDVLRRQIGEVLAGARRSASGSLAIDLGLVDTPSGGYLPVDPARDVRAQVAAFFGRGVDLRFCAVRPDFIPEALQEAQHADRISLTQGIDDPSRLEEVDVLVPDGTYETVEAPQSRLYEGKGVVGGEGWAAMKIAMPAAQLSALARSVHTDGRSWRLLARSEDQQLSTAATPPVVIWADVGVGADVFDLGAGGATTLTVHLVLHYPDSRRRVFVHDVVVEGSLRLVGAAGGDLVDTRVDAQVVARKVRGSGNPSTTSEPLGISQLRWRRTFDGGVPRIDLTVVEGEPPLTGLARLAGQALQLAISHGGQLSVGRGSLAQRPAISPEDPEWVPINELLGELATARGRLGLEDGFAARAADRLLGPATGPEGPRQVRATTDWVMFHRRRRIECEDAQRPTPVALRRYRILAVVDRARPARGEAAEEVVAQPTFGEEVGRASFVGPEPMPPTMFVSVRPSIEVQPVDARAVTIVEFEQGDGQLRSDPDGLRQAWLRLAPAGLRLTRSVIFDVEPEPEAVGLARLGAVEAVLPVDASAVTRQVSREELPQEISRHLTGVDGLIGLVVSRAPQPPRAEDTLLHIIVVSRGQASEIQNRLAEAGESVDLGSLVADDAERVLATVRDGEWVDADALGSPGDFNAVALLRGTHVGEDDTVNAALKVIGEAMDPANPISISDATVDGLDDVHGVVVAFRTG